MTFKMLMGALTLFAALDAHAAKLHDRDDAGRGARPMPMVHLYDSTASAAQAYALTDPSSTAQPPLGVLLAVALGMLGLTLAFKPSSKRGPSA